MKTTIHGTVTVSRGNSKIALSFPAKGERLAPASAIAQIEHVKETLESVVQELPAEPAKPATPTKDASPKDAGK